MLLFFSIHALDMLVGRGIRRQSASRALQDKGHEAEDELHGC
jgi:hypothetical protein